jgi:membrane-associated phospholipid phosphatase
MILLSTMEEFIKRHASFWRNKIILKHLLISALLFIISLFLFYFAKVETNEYSGYVVPDILLDNIPVFNVGFIFFQGAFILIVILALITLIDPKYIPFVLENSALFIFIRSIFMNMTYLSAPNVEYYKYTESHHHIKNVIFTISSGNDLFFSGHAGFPFLIALVFWNKKPIRYFFLVCSFIGAVAVILGHLHYTIDVFSSYFIAFGIFELSKIFFKKEYRLTDNVTI